MAIIRFAGLPSRAFAAALTLAFVPAPIVHATEQGTVFRIVTGPGQSAGKRKGGLLCLPNGSFERRDFVESDRAFEIGLRAAAADAGIARLEDIVDSVTLAGSEVNLCARHFLPGQSAYYSGKVRFDFEVVRADGSQHLETIEWKVAKDASMSAFEIFQSAMARLAERLMAG